MAASDISRVEMIWNETQMFAQPLIAEEWRDKNWADIPENVRGMFSSLVSADIPGHNVNEKGRA